MLTAAVRRRRAHLLSFRVRLTVLMCVTLGPLVVLVLHTGLEHRDLVATRERASVRRLALGMSASHEGFVNEARRLVLTLARVPVVLRGDALARRRLFADLLGHYEGCLNLGIGRGDGQVLASALPLEAPLGAATQELFARTARAGGPVTGPARIDDGGIPTIAVTQAVAEGPAQSPAFVFVLLTLDWLARPAALATLPPEASLEVWDASGKLLLRKPHRGDAPERSPSDAQVFAAIRASAGAGTAEALGHGGVRRLYGLAEIAQPSDGPPSILAVGVPTASAFAETRKVERRSLVVIGVSLLFVISAAWLAGDRLLVRAFGAMAELASIDALTGLTNRRLALAIGAKEFERARRSQRPLSAIMIDIDRFKKVNDAHGHGAGDDVLRGVAERCTAAVRQVDWVARFGGEEFLLILPDTAITVGREAAERVRMRVVERPFLTRGGPVEVTISAGVAEIATEDRGFEDLIEAADRALYAAKQAGRNRVEVGASRRS
jgi:diguanylate cyclase (GGDEF)-like protein